MGLYLRVPKSYTQFLHLASYYRHFIPKCAPLAQCLHNLVSQVSTKRKNSKKTSSPNKSTNSETNPQMQPFEWMEEHQASSDAHKHALTTAPELSTQTS